MPYFQGVPVKSQRNHKESHQNYAKGLYETNQRRSRADLGNAVTLLSSVVDDSLVDSHRKEHDQHRRPQDQRREFPPSLRAQESCRRNASKGPQAEYDQLGKERRREPACKALCHHAFHG